jgi:hypothetical protein
VLGRPHHSWAKWYRLPGWMLCVAASAYLDRSKGCYRRHSGALVSSTPPGFAWPLTPSERKYRVPIALPLNKAGAARGTRVGGTAGPDSERPDLALTVRGLAEMWLRPIHGSRAHRHHAAAAHIDRCSARSRMTPSDCQASRACGPATGAARPVGTPSVWPARSSAADPGRVGRDVAARSQAADRFARSTGSCRCGSGTGTDRSRSSGPRRCAPATATASASTSPDSSTAAIPAIPETAVGAGGVGKFERRCGAGSRQHAARAATFLGSR